MNNKGFTLIEVLAAFVLLGILATFATVSVIDYLDAADESALTTLKENIKAGMINYYNECKYLSTGVCSGFSLTSKPEVISGVSKVTSYSLNMKIADLVNKGFLESQGESTDIVDPTDNETRINECEVSITYYTDSYSEENKRQTFSEVSFVAGECGSLKS